MADKPRGRPRVKPDNAQRLHLDWASKRQIELAKYLGKGNKSAGFRRVFDALLSPTIAELNTISTESVVFVNALETKESDQ